MDNIDLLKELNLKIIDIYKANSLVSLSGNDKGKPHKIDGEFIFKGYNELTRKRNCYFKNKHKQVDYDKHLTDLIDCSDSIIYFIAHLFLYYPHVTNPIKNQFNTDKCTIYPFNMDTPTKRYLQFVDVCFEKIYNYWDRIGDLIATFFPDKFKEKKKIYFKNTINKLKNSYPESINYRWLKKFADNEFEISNKQRIGIVHYFTKNTDLKWTQLEQVDDFEKSQKLSTVILSFPDYFKKMNNLCLEGFKHTLEFLKEIVEIEDYHC